MNYLNYSYSTYNYNEGGSYNNIIVNGGTTLVAILGVLWPKTESWLSHQMLPRSSLALSHYSLIHLHLTWLSFPVLVQNGTNAGNLPQWASTKAWHKVVHLWDELPVADNNKWQNWWLCIYLWWLKLAKEPSISPLGAIGPIQAATIVCINYKEKKMPTESL